MSHTDTTTGKRIKGRVWGENKREGMGGYENKMEGMGREGMRI